MPTAVKIHGPNPVLAAGSVDTTEVLDLTLLDADVSASAAIALAKLAALTDGNIIVGSSANVATSVNPSGDVDVSNAGVFSIVSGVVVDADISASAAVAFSKLAALTDGNILVGNGSNVAVSVNPSGDVDISNAGVFSIASDVIINADVKTDAAIAYSKLAALAAGNVLVGSAANVATVTPAVTASASKIIAGVGSFAATISNASPGVVTSVAHGRLNGDAVVLSTTGALPAGLSVATTYYVVNKANDTFELSATVGGTSINTTDAGSGVHTVTYSGLSYRPLSIGAADIAVDAITNDKMATDSVQGSNIAATVVATGHLANSAVTSAKVEADLLQYADVQVTNTQLLALLGTDITLVATPGANRAILVHAIHFVFDVTATGYTIGTAVPAIGYSSDGANLAVITAAGFLDQATDQLRYYQFGGTAAAPVITTPVTNAGVVLRSTVADMTGGNAANTLSVRVYYSVVDTVAFS